MAAEFGLSFGRVSQVAGLCDRLNSRDSWQQTQVSRELVEALKAPMK